MKRALLVLCGCLAVGCQTADRQPFLELVPNEARDEPPGPEQETLLVSWRPAEGTGPLEVWLPLPGDGPELTVRSLAVEVDAGSFEVSGDSPRLLQLKAKGGAPAIRTRLLVERRQPLTRPQLPQPLAGLDPSLTPEAWVAQAAENHAAVPARVVYGLSFEGSSGSLCAWPEVELEGAWHPVELKPALPPDRLRLGPTQPHATRDGNATELSVEAQRL